MPLRIIKTMPPLSLPVGYRDFYKGFGMVFSTPVYDIEHTDWELYKKGITPKRMRLTYSVKFFKENIERVKEYIRGEAKR